MRSAFVAIGNSSSDVDVVAGVIGVVVVVVVNINDYANAKKILTEKILRCFFQSAISADATALS